MCLIEEKNPAMGNVTLNGLRCCCCCCGRTGAARSHTLTLANPYPNPFFMFEKMSHVARKEERVRRLNPESPLFAGFFIRGCAQ